MNVTKKQMLEFVEQMEYIARMALERKVTWEDLRDQFRIIRESIERWEK